MRTLIRVLLILLCVLFGMMLLLNIASFVFGDSNPLGIRCAVVLTGSMEPTIHVNDMVIVHKQPDYRIGDIVMYSDGRATVTHRIVAINPKGYVTRGDANNTPDSPIPLEQIIGRVVLVIPQIGILLGFLKSPYGMVSIVFVFIVMEILNRLYYQMKREA